MEYGDDSCKNVRIENNGVWYDDYVVEKEELVNKKHKPGLDESLFWLSHNTQLALSQARATPAIQDTSRRVKHAVMDGCKGYESDEKDGKALESYPTSSSTAFIKGRDHIWLSYRSPYFTYSSLPPSACALANNNLKTILNEKDLSLGSPIINSFRCQLKQLTDLPDWQDGRDMYKLADGNSECIPQSEHYSIMRNDYLQRAFIVFYQNYRSSLETNYKPHYQPNTFQNFFNDSQISSSYHLKGSVASSPSFQLCDDHEVNKATINQEGISSSSIALLVKRQSSEEFSCIMNGMAYLLRESHTELYSQPILVSVIIYLNRLQESLTKCPCTSEITKRSLSNSHSTHMHKPSHSTHDPDYKCRLLHPPPSYTPYHQTWHNSHHAHQGSSRRLLKGDHSFKEWGHGEDDDDDKADEDYQEVYGEERRNYMYPWCMQAGDLNERQTRHLCFHFRHSFPAIFLALISLAIKFHTDWPRRSDSLLNAIASHYEHHNHPTQTVSASIAPTLHDFFNSNSSSSTSKCAMNVDNWNKSGKGVFMLPSLWELNHFELLVAHSINFNFSLQPQLFADYTNHLRWFLHVSTKLNTTSPLNKIKDLGSQTSDSE